MQTKYISTEKGVIKASSFVSDSSSQPFWFWTGRWALWALLLLYDGPAPHLSLVDGNPISSGKPLVALDIIDAIPEVTKALGQVHLQQISQQVLQVWAEMGWKANLWTVKAVSEFILKPIIFCLMSSPFLF